MRNQLQPLFIQVELDDEIIVNKVLIVGGAIVNLLP